MMASREISLRATMPRRMPLLPQAKPPCSGVAGAIQDFSKAIELNPASAVAFLGRGNARFTLKDNNGALQDFNKVITLQPTNSNVYFNMGVIYGSQNKSQEAIRAYRQYSALEPAEWHGFKNTADIYYLQLANPDSSALYYSKALQIKKDDKEIIERYGYSLLKQKKINEAIAMFRNQLTLLPDDPWGYYNTACALSIGKQYNDALSYLSRALEKKMQDLGYWQTDKCLDNVRLLEDFKNLVKKYFTKDELAKYPFLFSFGGRD